MIKFLVNVLLAATITAGAAMMLSLFLKNNLLYFFQEGHDLNPPEIEIAFLGAFNFFLIFVYLLRTKRWRST